MYLPRVDEDASRAEDEGAAGESKTGHENILLVEDDEAVRELAREALTVRGHAVTSASGPKQAIEICSQQTKRVDLLITDAVMPEMSGPEKAARLATMRPGLKILLMSGYTQPQVGSGHRSKHGVPEEAVHARHARASRQTNSGSTEQLNHSQFRRFSCCELNFAQ